MSRVWDEKDFKAWWDNPITKEVFKTGAWESQAFNETFGWGHAHLMTYKKLINALDNSE